jgi:hypothetical protein
VHASSEHVAAAKHGRRAGLVMAVEEYELSMTLDLTKAFSFVSESNDR